MSDINTGGPAFARPQSQTEQGGAYEQDGMTLRDYFAGQALSSIGEYIVSDTIYAAWCYRMADEMIKARDAK